MARLVVVEGMNIQNMAEALKARDAGMASSAGHAEADSPGWGERAYHAAIEAFDWQTGEATMEHIRAVAHFAIGLSMPAELRAWGSVTAKLIRDGIIEPVGYARAASSNGSPKRTYRLVRAG